jgi:hypothetical protein
MIYHNGAPIHGMRMNRRTMLRAIAGSTVVLLPGCGAQGKTDVTSPARCQGDAVSVDRSYTDPEGYQTEGTDQPGVQENIEYFPSNSTVKVASLVSGDTVERTQTVSFEEWGHTQAASLAHDAVTETVTGNIEFEFSSQMGTLPGTTDVEPGSVFLNVPRSGNESDSARSKLSTLVEVAPKSADVTIHIKGDSYSRSVPIYARYKSKDIPA